jgi:hypothetical protein
VSIRDRHASVVLGEAINRGGAGGCGVVAEYQSAAVCSVRGVGGGVVTVAGLGVVARVSRVARGCELRVDRAHVWWLVGPPLRLFPGSAVHEEMGTG